MTDAHFRRWIVFLAIASGASACAVERAVVATLDSESAGALGLGGTPAGELTALAGGGLSGSTQESPLASAGAVASGGAPTTNASGGVSGLEGAVGGGAGVEQREVAGSPNDCLNLIDDGAEGGAGNAERDGSEDAVCACLGQAPLKLCGSDGVTYDALCGNDCPMIEIDCMGECPCPADDEAPVMMFWSPAECSEGFACIFSSQGTLHSSCITLAE